jgi:hypothetical protein
MKPLSVEILLSRLATKVYTQATLQYGRGGIRPLKSFRVGIIWTLHHGFGLDGHYERISA